METIIYPAKEEDYDKVRNFANQAGRNLAFTETAQYLLMTDKSDKLLATLGVYIEGNHALIRSLVMDSAACKIPDLFHFLDTAAGYAEGKGAKAVFFATLIPGELFAPLGFEVIAFTDLPGDAQQVFFDQYSRYPQTLIILKKTC
ncbi:hypothetical protein EV207_1547 [Scopulibacillus darangshiensis]|uniref:N-acetylglutamate synthase-like GNAT family acetyltransferase n=1 Tax=Scopulibacillus darangshiensis TaxID=442528 RepID=A0A4R2NGG9_9BACL|nr:hypothetical protein [Scopulibacillus darangshiensis]TCP20245.1 hypothetical protein EV207_1547 [Scopulibacillus darangshiensis]